MVTPQPAMHIRQPMTKPYPNSVQEMIEKWMADGDTKQQAIERFERITYCKIPEVILNTIKEKI